MDNKPLRIMREELEEIMLSPYATRSSRAKRKKWKKPCDVRTEFQRDRDRILYSKAFRRLMHKTQVFIAPEGDHYRTRLTHTLEVSQIARTIARALRLNDDLTEAISLGHDLGHAPFGHAGESALNILMNEFTGKGFHHSLQSLRVVDYLERDGGLNLTLQVRNGIVSHTKGKSDLDGPAVFEEPQTLEAEVVRVSDRLAYINHDIDDAIRAGIIKKEDLPKKAVELFGHGISKRVNAMVLDIVHSSWEKPHITMSTRISDGIKILKDFMFNNVYTNSPAKEEEYKAFFIIRQLFEHFMRNPGIIPPVIVERGGGKGLRYAQYCPREDIDIESVSIEYMDDLDRNFRAQAVCDFIAGMTDRYAVAIHSELFIPKSWGARGFKIEER
ncbi:MAG: deoxyguanosinetriphosphate triphosphohydrolase [Candidatus Eremiobacteraeota bacterium]|nr:deoxyguanosinetriphosphate triphosphohydrolase [Candidatus Eremiobacteraeota bacterium]